MFARSRLARPSAVSASIDVLASDAVATKGLTAIFVPFVPGTKYGQAAQPHPPEYADLVPGTFLMGTALSLLIIAILSSKAALRDIGDSTERPMLSFAQRAEAAGITLDSDPPSTARLAVSQPYDAAIPHHRDTLHLLDTRSLLQGDL